MNLLITFTISGLWHGANWTYVVWGVLNGFYLVCGICHWSLFATALGAGCAAVARQFGSLISRGALNRPSL